MCAAALSKRVSDGGPAGLLLLEAAGQPRQAPAGVTGTCGFLRLPDGHTDPSDIHGQGRDCLLYTSDAADDC